MRKIIAQRAEALADFPGQTLPEGTAQLLARAEKIAGGTIFFYGRKEVQVGLRGIDWTGSHVAHQEWPAQLNRFFHLPPLAAAYLKTGDERFAQAARSYIEDWIESHPGYEKAERFMPGDSGLNMSIRLGTSHSAGWGGTLPAFLSSPSFDDYFLAQIADSISVQAAFLADHLTPWGNWRISELDALVFIALRFPFLDNAADLLPGGVKGMRNALATQFLDDGVHIERCPGYHEWMSDVLASYVDLGRRFPEADAKPDSGALLRALDYSAQDELFGVNDSRAPHRDPERPSHAEHRKSVLARLFPAMEASDEPPLQQVFPDAGHVFARSSWRPGADYLAFDASTWGGGHGHLSRLSFVFRSGGRALVADPGILNYEMSDPFGPYGKATRAHSTLCLNGWNQSEADADLIRAEFAEGITLVHARYSGGYWEGEYGWSFGDGHGRGLFGIHERALLWVKGEYLLALDGMTADRGATVHNCWQLGPMDGWTMDRESLSWSSRNADVNALVKCLPFVQGTEMECFEGSRDPIRGWVGQHGDDAIPAPLVEFRYPSGISGDSPCAVLIAAFRGEAPPRYSAKQASLSGWAHVRHLELSRPDGGTDLLTWSKALSSPAEYGSPVVSDAPFVWLRLDPAGQPVKSFIVEGSYLDWAGRMLHEAPRRESKVIPFS